MLATETSRLAMNPGLRQDLVASDGPLAGVTLKAVEPIGGGCIHQAWSLQLGDGRRLFVKSGEAGAINLFRVEADALEALHQHAATELLVVPQPLAMSQLPHGDVLLLPWLDLGGVDQRALGRGLAWLHRCSEAASPGTFGWHRDGFIGSGAQPGGWRNSWGACFVELRLRPQLQQADRLGFDPLVLDRLLTQLTNHLDRHAPLPALVHGDLWGGNAGSLSDGRGALFDPATYWADREVDLAMTRMFGGFDASFYSAYNAEYPVAPGAEERIEIYNLYHLINHANLFGGGYIKQSRASLQRLARLLS